ncbi:MAG TPA: LacI family DNA-binding transcriptional regulator [Candidatus Acidoferrum sp.]|jgi:LacI family transcriptional regulator|nr:LacI family DNA-binding transcriptional regulator [Candidatus Acidoferrum sp.]
MKPGPLPSGALVPDDAGTEKLVKRPSSKSAAVTMRDVANASGFSPATVSIVLNNAPLARYIAPATKKKIEDSARKLGYRPNVMARFLRSKRTHSVGVMFFDVTDPFCTPILRGIENSLFQGSYVPILADAHNQRNRFERYLELLLERHVEALVVVANWLFVDIHLLADFSKRNIPAATIGWELPGDTVSSVMVDNEAGGRLAMEHLHKLGHRKIAYIRGPKTLIDSGPRWKGIQKFAHAAGLEIDSDLTMQLPEAFDPNSGFEGGFRLTEEFLQRRKKFTALLAFDDLTAFGAIRALNKAGIRVPEQCSVIGFDDVALSALAAPSLTTVRQPLEVMGNLAVNIIMEGIAASQEKREWKITHQRVAPELMIRESTQAIAISSSHD